MTASVETRNEANRFGRLSKREQQVAELVCRGSSNKTIARQLGVTEGTVKQHLCAIYRTLGAKNRTELIIAFSDRTTPPLKDR